MNRDALATRSIELNFGIGGQVEALAPSECCNRHGYGLPHLLSVKVLALLIERHTSLDLDLGLVDARRI